jgi:very-short-patch-repair endonuclease
MLVSTGEWLLRGPGNRAPRLFGFGACSVFCHKACAELIQTAHHPRAETGHDLPGMAAPAPKTPADGPQSGQIGRFEARRRGVGVSKDGEIARVAARQRGLISLEQLRRVGVSKDAASKRVAAGRLYRVHEGVFAVRYPLLSRNGRFLATVLACGPGAVLSHRSAAVLWGLLEDLDPSVDVTAPNRRGRIPKGICAHRDGSLTPVDRTEVHGIPCTSVARTLLDLAGVVAVSQLRKAISEAEVRRVLDHGAVRRLIKRNRGRRGVARLRVLMDDIHPETKRTRSEMERRFLRMCEKTGLPHPEVNVPLDAGGVRLTPDFLWRDAGLIVEADGRRYHDTDSAFQLDRRREQRLQLAGWRVSRCTWEQIDREPRNLADTIRGLLAQPSPPPMGLKADK